jgi:hypothetical protein
MSEISIDRSYYPPLAKEIASWQRDYTPGPLTQDEFYQFFEDGFVIKHNLLKKDQLESAIHGVEGVVDELAQELYQAVRPCLLRSLIYFRNSSGILG